MQPALITTKEFIEKLGISESAFFRLRIMGKIGPRSIKLGRSIRWDAVEVEAWIKEKCPQARDWESR